MSGKKVSNLSLVFFVGAASAAAALLLSPYLEPFVSRYLILRGAEEPKMISFTAYTLGFTGCFVVLSFLGHHASLRLSLQATNYEKASGAAPRLARFLLVALLFAAPLSFLLHQGGALGWMLEHRKTFTQRQAADDAAQNGQGYKAKDREKLDRLIHEGAHDD